MSTLHTQAGNFLDFLKTGVDQRTGQFTLAIALPLPPANQLCGPTLPLTLSFNLLNSALDRGYGQGWALGLSEIDLDQKAARLRLSSGEQFAVDLGASQFTVNGRLALRDQKLATFLVTWQADGSLRVDHKSGECEILRCQDSDSGRYLLAELRSPEGRRLFFDWLPFAEGDYRLQQIRDEQRTLLSLEDRQGELHFILNPHSEQSATLRVLLSNDWLTEVHLPGVDEPLSIDYEPIDLAGATTLLLPSYIRSPLGAEDFVHWASDSDGHHLPPGAPFPYLPRVTAWTHATGRNGNELNRSYTWLGEHNFLGFGSDQAFVWHTGRDNLYQVEGDYRYEVIETLSDGDGRALGSHHFTWDRHHLLVSEVTRQGLCETRRTTTHGVDPSLTWEQQPAWCQLPLQVCMTYIDHARDGASRTETTTYRYDDAGNILHVRYPSGVEEHNSYYPATGADGCPADALGRVRWLRHKTVMPAPADGQAPTLGTLYTYQALPSLLEGEPAHTVVAREQGWDESEQRLLESTSQAYCTAPGTGYGRLAGSATTLNGKTTTTEYRYRTEHDELVTQTTLIGFENDAENRSTRSDARSLLSGLTTWERDEAGALTTYAHDALGRIVRTITAANSPYQAERQASYHLGDAVARQAGSGEALNPVMVEQVEITGRRQRQWLDGDGRTVRVELEDIQQAPGTFRTVAHTQFDAMGRPVSETAVDWLGEGIAPLRLTTTTAYDDWGQAALSISPEGIERHVRHDPVRQRTEHWQVAAGRNGPRQVIELNAAGSPARQQHFDSDGQLVRTLKLTRDGLDRVIEERLTAPGATDIVNRKRYDHYSRLVEHQLPDGTRLAWTFAAHSDDQHVESIAITPAPAQAPA